VTSPGNDCHFTVAGRTASVENREAMQQLKQQTATASTGPLSSVRIQNDVCVAAIAETTTRLAARFMHTHVAIPRCRSLSNVSFYVVIIIIHSLEVVKRNQHEAVAQYNSLIVD